MKRLSAIAVLICTTCGARAESNINAEGGHPNIPQRQRNPAEYERFATSKTSTNLAVVHDLSGVGRVLKQNGQFVPNISRWGTLISRHFAVGVGHAGGYMER